MIDGGLMKENDEISFLEWLIRWINESNKKVSKEVKT